MMGNVTLSSSCTTNTNEIQRITKGYFQNVYFKKLENLEEMDKFLDAFNLPKFNQKDINHLKRTIASNEIEAGIKSLPTKKSPGSYGLTAKFYQNFKEELTVVILKPFHETEWEEYYQTHSVIPKPDKNPKETKEL
jgi:hypothetical protein